MRSHTLQHWFYLISTGAFLFGGSCIAGKEVQGAFTDSLVSVLGNVFTVVLEQVFRTFVSL